MESLYLDPALNYIFEKMKKEVDMSKSRVEEMQNEMKAWKFNSDRYVIFFVNKQIIDPFIC